jgi:hypothetical protein
MGLVVPLAGLEPPTCCWTLCWSAEPQVADDRRAKVISSFEDGCAGLAPTRLLYPARLELRHDVGQLGRSNG